MGCRRNARPGQPADRAREPVIVEIAGVVGQRALRGSERAEHLAVQDMASDASCRRQSQKPVRITTRAHCCILSTLRGMSDACEGYKKRHAPCAHPRRHEDTL